MEINEEVVRVNGIPQRLVIFLHGYIDTAFALEPRLENLFQSLDNTAFHLPQSPLPCEIHENKRQWFSMHRFDPNDERKTVATIEESLAIYEKMKIGIAETAEYLERYIDNCVMQYNLSYDKVFLAGFSQGGTMAIYLALMMPEKIGGCIDFNGVLTPHIYLREKHLQTPDFLLIHGTADNIVRFPILAYNTSELEAMGCKVETKIIDNENHRVTPEGLLHTADFIKKRSHSFGK